MAGRIRWQICAFVLLSLCLVQLTPVAVAEGNTVVLDCSDDFASYAQTVASLNKEQRQHLAKRGDDSSSLSFSYYVLLCKTDGEEIDFSQFGASYIVAGPKHCFTLFFETEKKCDEAVTILDETNGIIYAEKDSDVHAAGTVSNNSAGSFHSWGAVQMAFGNYLSYASMWGHGSVTVAIVDSGVFLHSLIRSRIRFSGYDYVDADDDATNDLFGHGTNVAGIVVDCTANQPVYIYPIRVLTAGGNGKMSNVVNAVREAISKHVQIINLSLESSIMSDALDDAIRDALASGITVVVAAGNSGISTSQVCPAHLTNSGVIVVGSAEAAGDGYTRASYSNFGASVDVYAFGSNISCCSISGGFSTETGTSMAAPHVTAFCALLQLIHPGLSPSGTEQRVRNAANGQTGVAVPFLTAAIPQSMGFQLSHICIGIGETLRLPVSAFPQSASEAVQYYSSDDSLLVVNGGCLTATAAGTVILTASCTGMEESAITVDIVNQPSSVYSFPVSLIAIEEEAFANNNTVTEVIIPNGVKRIDVNAFEGCSSLRIIHIPDSVEDFGENTFSEAIILCSENSRAYAYAVEKSLQYVLEQ